MIPIVTPAEMRAIDQQASEPLDELIGRAAWHVARAARDMLGGVYGRRVSVVAGPGNNGEDARVAARILQRWGVRVSVVPPDAETIPSCDLVIDGAFGTGLSRPYEAPPIPPGARVLAIDIASGLDGLTGELRGLPMKAERTVTFAALKPGLLLQPGANVVGTLELAEIGLDTSGASAWLLTMQDAARLLPRRPVDDHKWKRAVWVVGGSDGMLGAPFLAAQAVLRSGGGMVWCGLPGQEVPSSAHEVVFRRLPEHDWHEEVLRDGERFGALVVGPGLGRSVAAAESVRRLVDQSSQPMVIDGDALRLLGERPQLRANIVLTPHDGEFAALAGAAPGADRFAAARSLAAQTGAVVLLKGPLTIVASPDGDCLCANNADQRLATAGSGDVLAGVIGSYLAGGLEPGHAAAVAAWIHGAAGLTQAAVGMVASDLLDGLTMASSRLMNVTADGGIHAFN